MSLAQTDKPAKRRGFQNGGVTVWHPVALSSNATANSVSLGTVGLLEIPECVGFALLPGAKKQPADDSERGEE